MKLGKSQEPFDYVVTDTNKAATIRYLGDSSSVKVPVQIDGNSVTELSPFTFTDRPDITEVIIPNGIETLG